MENSIPFQQGYEAKLAAENPYWLNYPKEATSEEKSKAWQFVDGFCQKAREEFYLKKSIKA